MKNGKVSVAIQSAIAVLIKLADAHGIEGVNQAYAESIAALMADQTREEWRTRIATSQTEMLMLEGR